MLDNIKIVAIYCLLLSFFPVARAMLANESGITFCHILSPSQTGGWQQLNDQCDIGSGLWGKKPKPTKGSFWVQCNYSRSLPNKTFSEKVNTLFPGKTYLVKEGNKFRCLVGPYPAYSHALKAKKRFADQQITNTFIRQTTNTIKIFGEKQQGAYSGRW